MRDLNKQTLGVDLLTYYGSPFLCSKNKDSNTAV